MDPLSITAACFAVAQICVSISKSCSKFAEGAANVDNSLEGLDIELRNLGVVVEKVETTFRAKPQQIEYWKHTYEMLERCRLTLDQLKTILEGLNNRHHHSIPRKPLMQYRLNKKQPTISLLRGQISSYIQMLQIWLQTISL